MKKSIAIPVLIFSGVVALSAISNAYALYTLPSSSVNFGVSQAIDYYLKGSFNDWAQENTYKFVNNTNEMEPEEGKIKEYVLENIALNKDAYFKVWANNSVWFVNGTNNCTYEHHWSNSITYVDNGEYVNSYIVPMTSNTYTLYLRFYNDGSSKLNITANKDILYFIPSGNWKSDGAVFAIEMFNDNDQSQEIITTSVENPSGTFKFNIGSTYHKYKYLRQNSGRTETWNYSNIVPLGNDDTNNCFELWNNVWDGGAVWSGWTPTGGSTPYQSNGVWSTK